MNDAPVHPVLSFVRSVAVLTVLGAGTLGVGWALGAYPLRDPVQDRRVAREREAATRRAAEAARRPAPVPDAGVAEAAPSAPALRRWVACDSAGESALHKAKLGADGREVLIVACEDLLLAVAFVHGEPLEVLRFAPVRDDASARVRVYTIVSEDVTGDGALDWLIGTYRAPDATSPATGALYLAAGDGRGGLAPPVPLAPLAVGRIVTGLLDVDSAVDFAVLHRPDPMGSRAPEAWIFAGGVTPTRAARVALPRDVTDVSLYDVDLDGHLDLVPVGRTELDAVRAGDGSFGFDRPIAARLPPYTRVERVRGAAFGQGLLLVGAAPAWLSAAAPAGNVQTLALPAAPVAVDAAASGTALELSWVNDGFVDRYSREDGELRRRGRAALDLASGRVVDVAIGNFVGDEGLETALLVERSGTVRERDLVLLDRGAEGPFGLDATRTVVERSPLHLESTLR